VAAPVEIPQGDGRRPLSTRSPAQPLRSDAELGDDEERRAACVLLLLDFASGPTLPIARR
jgi:hypothetical protein